MNNRLKNLRWSRRLSFVPRWSVVPTIRQQKVDQHVYGVTQIARSLLSDFHTSGFNDDFCYRVVCACLDHDNSEAAFGDQPSPSKPPTYTPCSNSDQVVVVLKCADILEAIMFLHEEQRLGNAWVESVIMELIAKFHDWWDVFEVKNPGHKMLSSDVIRYFSQQFLNSIHPAMEASRGI